MPPSANDDLPSIWHNVIGGVPPPLSKPAVNFLPVARIIPAGTVYSDDMVAGIVSPGLDQRAVGHGGAGGAPDVGEHREWGGWNWR